MVHFNLFTVYQHLKYYLSIRKKKKLFVKPSFNSKSVKRLLEVVPKCFVPFNKWSLARIGIKKNYQ